MSISKLRGCRTSLAVRGRAVWVAAVMAVCFFGGASAAQTPNTGWYNITDSSFTISTADQLAGLAAIVNGTWGGTPARDGFGGKTITLDGDIDLSMYDNWTPIGNSPYMLDRSNEFSGTFDGGGHIISGLTINSADADMRGLFGNTFHITVKNLKLYGVKVNGRRATGSLIGYSQGANIINCYSNGVVSGTIEAGGLIGSLSFGGLVANSHSAAAVSGDSTVGGVAGVINGGSLINSYSTGTVSGISKVGGVIGVFVGHSLTGSLISCAALNPEVKGTGSHVGRVVGSRDGGTLSNNVAYAGMTNRAGNARWTNKGAADIGGADIALAAIKLDGTIGGRFTADSGWTAENGKLPGIGAAIAIPGYMVPSAPDTRWYTENPDALNFTIFTADELAGLAQIVNGTAGNGIAINNFSGKSITLADNIDLFPYDNWTPIGYGERGVFSGTFTGNEYTISNLTINHPAGGYHGLFGRVRNGTVVALGLDSVNITGGYAGALAGLISDSSRVVACYSNGRISGVNTGVGGLIGDVRTDSRVDNCYSIAVVSGTSNAVGGLAGAVQDNSILTNSYSAGEVSSTGMQFVGGVAGAIARSSITNCAALNYSVKFEREQVTSDRMGRVTGLVAEGTLSNNAAFVKMKKIFEGDSIWTQKGGDAKDGEDITAEEIISDGTIGGRFTGERTFYIWVWTTENGKLPGLFGKTVPLPAYLDPNYTEIVSVASSGRVIPPVNSGDAGIIAPVNTIKNMLTAGPNPAGKSGTINFFRQGKSIKSGTLKIYDAAGNAVKKISVADNMGDQPRRIVGSWDLTDRKGRAVSGGTYLIRGTITTIDGNKEKVSLPAGVR
ncbi:MAG: hypothetical protein FWB85_10725 [Chitinispirillia bacterium]|nr:hypothetical protein [Chitinispirillia bacterium]